MATNITQVERNIMRDSFRDAPGEDAIHTLEAAYWTQYTGKASEWDAKRTISAIRMLYKLVPRGSKITCVYLRTTGERRVYQVVTAHDGRVVRITGYINALRIIGRETKDEALATTGYPDGIAGALGSFLYGDDNSLKSERM